MADIVPFDDPTNYSRVKQRLKRLWEGGLFQILQHAQDRMKERDLDITDIGHAIRYGSVVEHSLPGKLWRYKVEGRSVDGARMACIVEINGHLIVVTVITARRGTPKRNRR